MRVHGRTIIIQHENRNQHDQELPALKLLGKQVVQFIRTLRGPVERALEGAIVGPPCNSKHNPYYGGKMNSGDITKLLEFLDIVFNAIRNASTSQEMEEHLDNHETRWSAFAKVSPLL
jgi:hypothetical protein